MLELRTTSFFVLGVIHKCGVKGLQRWYNRATPVERERERESSRSPSARNSYCNGFAPFLFIFRMTVVCSWANGRLLYLNSVSLFGTSEIGLRFLPRWPTFPEKVLFRRKNKNCPFCILTANWEKWAISIQARISRHENQIVICYLATS